MEEVSDLVKLYSTKTNLELYDISSEIGGYTEEAIEAFHIVVEERGGVDYINKEFKNFAILDQEKISVKKEVISLLSIKTSTDEIFGAVESKLLDKANLEIIINETITQFNEQKEDKNFHLKTLIFGLIGGVISCSLGVFLLRMILQQGYEIRKIMLIIFLLLNYVVISSFTKKTYKNITVILLTVLFTFLTLVFNKEYISY